MRKSKNTSSAGTVPSGGGGPKPARKTVKAVLAEIQPIVDKAFSGHDELYDVMFMLQQLCAYRIHEEAMFHDDWWIDATSPVDRAEDVMERAFWSGVARARSRYWHRICGSKGKGDAKWRAEYKRMFGKRRKGHELHSFDGWRDDEETPLGLRVANRVAQLLCPPANAGRGN